MPKTLNLINEKYGNLTVIAKADKVKGKTAWLCKCDCGNTKVVLQMHLRKGDTTSCGCARSKWQIRHGMTKTRFYQIWSNMKRRCDNPNDVDYPNYGLRGITYCHRWLIFDNFYDDMFDSYKEHVALYGEANTTIDRIDSNDCYYKENCRWTDRKTQARNTRKASKPFRAISPNGEVFYSNSQRSFAEEHNLTPDYINKKLNNRKKASTRNTKSWSFEFIEKL